MTISFILSSSLVQAAFPTSLSTACQTMRSDETSITMKQFLRQTRRSCFIRPTNLKHAGTLIFVLFSTGEPHPRRTSPSTRPKACAGLLHALKTSISFNVAYCDFSWVAELSLTTPASLRCRSFAAVVTSGCHTKDVKQASGDINEDAPLEEGLSAFSPLALHCPQQACTCFIASVIDIYQLRSSA